MEKREQILEKVYRSLGYTLDDSLRNVLLSQSQHKLIQAPAGGTKTSLATYWMNQEKKMMIQEGDIVTDYNVVFTVYNRHNTKDIRETNKKMYSHFQSLGYFNSSVMHKKYAESRVTATTIHSYAGQVIAQFPKMTKLKIDKFKPADNSVLDLMLSKAIQDTRQSKKPPQQQTVQNYKQLYNLYVNLLLYEKDSWEEIMKEDVFRQLCLDLDVPMDGEFKIIFDKYEKRKRFLKKLDHSDAIVLALELLESETIRSQVTRFIKILIIDEVQDLTKLMFKFVTKLIGPHTKTMAIGDPDQTIYPFNGASAENMDKYAELTGLDVETFVMSTNRRCQEGTMHFSRGILNELSYRFDKPIHAQKPGGQILAEPYGSIEDETEKIFKYLRQDMMGTTGVLFRAGKDSIPLSRYIYRKGMSVRTINAILFHEHLFYRTILDLMDKVMTNRGRDSWKYLYKVFPFSKSDMEAFLQIDAEGNPQAFPDKHNWANLDFSPLCGTNSTSAYQIIFLQAMSKRMYELPSGEYFSHFMRLVYKNYYSLWNDVEADPYFNMITDWLKDDFAGDIPILDAYNNLQHRLKSFISFNLSNPVTLSTIHSSKGLEFDRVVLARMEDKPQHKFIQDENLIVRQKDDDVRVYYVGATRQRKELYLSYSESNPHWLIKPEYIVPTEKLEVKDSFQDEPEKEKEKDPFKDTHKSFKRNFSLGGLMNGD